MPVRSQKRGPCGTAAAALERQCSAIFGERGLEQEAPSGGTREPGAGAGPHETQCEVGRSVWRKTPPKQQLPNEQSEGNENSGVCARVCITDTKLAGEKLTAIKGIHSNFTFWV